MTGDYSRSDRLATQIQRELALLIRDELKDPRIVNPSILDVQVTRDLSQAKVYFSVLDEADAEPTRLGLNAAAGFLQRQLGRLIRARNTPKLRFFYDDTDIRGRRMDELIDAVVAKDRQRSGEARD